MEKLTLLKSLLLRLPHSVPLRLPTDGIPALLSDVTLDPYLGTWVTYNHPVDHIFGSDCKCEGHFLHFTRSLHGLDLVVKFAEHFFALEGFDTGLGGLKIEAIIAEAQHYM
jgi:hypothetical protein